MKSFCTLLLSCFVFLAAAQDGAKIIKPLDLVNKEKNLRSEFQNVDPFTELAPLKAGNLKIDEGIDNYKLLDLKSGTVNQLKSASPDALQLELPALDSKKTLTLELVKVDIFTSDFEVIVASTRQAAQVDLGLHYRGIIKGDDNSVVSLSVFQDEVRGLISSSSGNLVLGKLKNDGNAGEHILYDDLEVLQKIPFDCGTMDDGVVYKPNDLKYDYNKSPGDCIRFYIEVDYDIHQNKGGVAGASSYITGLMNEVSTLYANESIPTVISQMIVWDVTSPYSSTSSSGMLSDFQANLGTFNGDLAQLFSYQASGGIAAGFAGICNSNPDNSMCFSSIDASYALVPTYSWSVMVATHEFGHLFGSRHTHACVWNGNGTAIDGCAGSTEGTCSLPGYPSVGGTLMSYCHLQSVGINFNEGFGPQPGNVIRNSVDSAACTSSCGPPSCTDGIQNQDETGVDCGGSTCPACPTCSDGIQNGDELGVDCGGSQCAPCPCNGQDVTLTIVLDNYPSETTWAITSGGLTYASGGPYSGAGSTAVEVNCLNDGCYDFIIYDSYGDGICCAYGNGSYLLEDASGNTLASGGSFGSSETTNFCLTTTPSINVTISSQTDVSCNGGSDGSATASASSGVAPYTYSWSNGYYTATTSGLSAGNYTVTATDAQGATGIAVASISEPSALAVTASSTDESCAGPNDGTASASSNGGTGSVSYAWSGPNGYSATGANISNLASGDYTVTATDANLCTAVDVTTVGIAGAGSSCDDGNPCTVNDVYDPNCNCNGTFQDSDGDGVCDADDICPGFDDNADADGDGIPDGCDSDCTVVSNDFPVTSLQHSGTGSTSTTLTYGAVNTDVSFTITGLNAQTNGNPNNRYIDEVTVSYMDDLGNSFTEGTYSGASQSSVSISITANVLSVTVSLADAYDGNAPGTLSVNLGSVSSCESNSGCPDDDNDGVCNANDICPGFDDNADADGDGIPDGCDNNNCDVVTDNFPVDPLTHSGGGSSSTTLSYAVTNQDVSFTISGLDAQTNGNPNNRYIEEVTVTYVDGNGATVTEGTYGGNNSNSVDISIAGDVNSVTVSLADGWDGNAPGTLSVNLGAVSSCIPTGSLVGGSDKDSTKDDDILTDDNEWKIYPNPGNEIMYVLKANGTLSEEKSDIQILVYTMNGHLAARFKKPDTGSIELDMSSLPQGHYYIRIIEESNVSTHKWLKF